MSNMDFKDQFKQLAERVSSLKEQIQTEEATKNAFIMPFIQMLGYDVFNPLEVVPEMDCDITKKKGEKIDYAIIKDGEPVMLIECKHWKQDLNLHETQLARYFVSSRSHFGVLTNGLVYRFYADLEEVNIMDKTPFLEIDIENAKEAQIEELKKFHKSYFEVDSILSTASELKYLNELRSVIKSEFQSPSADFVRLLAKRVYDGSVTQKIVDQFIVLTKRSIASYVNDIISERLNVAIQSTAAENDNARTQSETQSEKREEIQEDAVSKGQIVTTSEEKEGYYIVKSIARQFIDVERIGYKDVQSYFAVIVDGTPRKTICRLYFNSVKKYLVVCGAKEIKHLLSSLDEIYAYAEELRDVALLYSKIDE